MAAVFGLSCGGLDPLGGGGGGFSIAAVTTSADVALLLGSLPLETSASIIDDLN